jgi:hypothetical protein
MGSIPFRRVLYAIETPLINGHRIGLQQDPLTDRQGRSHADAAGPVEALETQFGLEGVI